MKKLSVYKSQIDKLQKKELELQYAMKNDCILPIWYDVKELKNIVSELPDGLIKFYVYNRIAELEKTNIIPYPSQYRGDI